MTMRLCDVRNRHYYYAEANASQSTEGAMKNTVFGDRRMSGLIAFKQRAREKRPILAINIAFRTAQITAQNSAQLQEDRSNARRHALRNA